MLKEFGMKKYALKEKKRFELTLEQKQEIKEAFELFDSDRNDRIDFAELRVALKALGFDAKKDEVKEFMKEFDPEDTGGISF